MHIVCALCGTDAPSVIYYVGEDESHCGDCWSVMFQKLMNAHVDFNTDAAVEAIDKEVKAQNCGPLIPNPEPEPGTIKVYAGASEFVGSRSYDWFNRVQSHYNSGYDRP